MAVIPCPDGLFFGSLAESGKDDGAQPDGERVQGVSSHGKGAGFTRPARGCYDSGAGEMVAVFEQVEQGFMGGKQAFCVFFAYGVPEYPSEGAEVVPEGGEYPFTSGGYGAAVHGEKWSG